METFEKIDILREAMRTIEKLMNKDEDKIILLDIKNSWICLQEAHLKLIIKHMEKKLETSKEED